MNIQLSNAVKLIDNEKSFENAFKESYRREKDLEFQIGNIMESKNDLASQLEQQAFVHKQQVAQLEDIILKTQNELSTCKADFQEHKEISRDRVKSYLDEIVELESQLKEFQNVDYKTGNSITTIHKLSVKRSNKGHGFAIGSESPSFLGKALAEIPKIYSAKHFFDESVIRAVVYDREEELEIEDETRSKMENVEYNTPFDYSKRPPISKTFVSQHDKVNEPYFILPEYLPSYVPPVTPVV